MAKTMITREIAMTNVEVREACVEWVRKHIDPEMPINATVQWKGYHAPSSDLVYVSFSSEGMTK